MAPKRNSLLLPPKSSSMVVVVVVSPSFLLAASPSAVCRRRRALAAVALLQSSKPKAAGQKKKHFPSLSMSTHRRSLRSSLSTMIVAASQLLYHEYTHRLSRHYTLCSAFKNHLQPQFQTFFFISKSMRFQAENAYKIFHCARWQLARSLQLRLQASHGGGHGGGFIF